MTRLLGTLVQLWAWLALAGFACALAAALGLVVAQLVPVDPRFIASALAQTIPVVSVACVGAGAVALLSAVALDQVLPRGPAVDVLRRGIAAAAGVPSVVFGLVGVLLVPWTGILTVSLVLALAMLPSLTLGAARILERAEPEERLAAQALGATPWQVLLLVIGPSAARGLIALLARTAGRMVGLVAPLLLLEPSGPMPIAWQIVERAASGDAGMASILAVVVSIVVIGANLASVLIDQRVAWRLP